MLKQYHLFLLAIVQKFFAVYIIDWKHLENKVLDYAAIFFVGCYRTVWIQNDLSVYAVACDEITEFLGIVNIIDFRRYQSRLRTFLNRASSNGDQLYATSLAKRGFIYLEHAGENLILCPFCFNYFYYDLVNDENVCTHAPNCPYAARAWDQHGNNNLGVMNLVVDVEDREIYRNVSNLYNLPFFYTERARQDSFNIPIIDSERTRQDSFNIPFIDSAYYSERTRDASISVRNLSEFQNIHSRENQIDNQSSVAHNGNSSSIVHQESNTNVAVSTSVIPWCDHNSSPDNVITHSSSTQGDLVGDPSSGFTISNIVSAASDLSSVVTSITSEIASTRYFSSNSEESPFFLSYATAPVDPFNRPTFVTATSTVITAQPTSAVSTNCASERNLISTTISSAAAAQISSTAVGPISTTAATQISTAVTQTVSETSQNSTKGNAGGPTYSELGIVTERPKRFEYAVLLKRIKTFLSWPRDHHLRPKELAEAGFYYAGYGDCIRCFYCGGGLRNWQDEDDVWVEHARWFPKCAYIRQQMGQDFVDIVQKLSERYNHITFSMVVEKMRNAVPASQFENTLSADTLYEKLVSDNINRVPNASRMFDLKQTKVKSESSSRVEEKLRALKEKNEQLRQQTVCKICMDKEVTIVFHPCGHFVSCTDCAAAMRDCPVCRKHIKGIVLAFIG